MPAEPPDVTPTIDMVGDRVAAQFPSGAMLTVSNDGCIELLFGSRKPTADEVVCFVSYLKVAGDLERAAAVERWAA